jgi:hypothetical protein
MSNIVYFPNLPNLPNNLIAKLDKFATNNKSVVPPYARSCSRRGVDIFTGQQARFEVDNEVTQWIEQYVAKDYTSIGVATRGGSGEICVPHTDATRDWTLMWVTDTGGPVDTVFYQQQEYPLRRDNATFPTTYDDLIELERHRILANCWVLLDALVLHGIEGFTHTRVALQIGFRDSANTVKLLTGNSNRS